MNQRLSSDNLFHFTNTNAIKGILLEGFRHYKYQEKIPFRGLQQQNFIVCFCDIILHDADSHKSCYGDNAIVLNKSWGIRNGISPVRYVHEESPGISDNYFRMKTRYREISEKKGTPMDKIIDYTFFSMLEYSNQLQSMSIQENIDHNPELLEKYFEHQKSFKSSIEQSDLFPHFNSLVNRIKELHHEIERRDAFTRIYQDDFECPRKKEVIKNKVLYDEREWRSVKTIKKEIDKDKKYLDSEYNLCFEIEDVEAILFNNENVLQEVQKFITNQIPDKDSYIKKLKLFSEYKE